MNAENYLDSMKNRFKDRQDALYRLIRLFQMYFWLFMIMIFHMAFMNIKFMWQLNHLTRGNKRFV